MTAGLPGAGIGGVFYLLAALVAPAWHLIRALGRRRSVEPWGRVLRNFVLAVAILSAMWLTGWLIGFVLTSLPVAREFAGGSVNAAYSQVIGRRMAVFTLGTLAAVLLAVEGLRLARLALQRWQRRTVAPTPIRRSSSCSTGRPRG